MVERAGDATKKNGVNLINFSWYSNITNMNREGADISMVMLTYAVAAMLYDWGNVFHENVHEIMLLRGKCEGKCREVIYCWYLTVAESAGTPQLILNLKRQFYQKKCWS